MPLVINSLRSRHTHILMQEQKQFQETRYAPGQETRHAPSLKVNEYYFYMHAYIQYMV